MKWIRTYLGRWRWIVWDLFAMQGALAVVLWLRFGTSGSAQRVPNTLIDYLGPAAWISLGWLIILAVFGLYRERAFPSHAAWLMRLFHAVTFGTLLLAIATFDPTRPFTEPRTILIGYWVAMLFFLGGGRLLPTLHGADDREESIVVTRRRLAVIASDAVLVVLSYYMAFWLRFDGAIPEDALAAFWSTLPLVFIVRFASFVIFRLYTGVWRYSSINDLLSILKAVSAGTGVLVLPVFFFGIPGYPRSVFLIDWFLLVILIGGVRFTLRAWRELRPRFHRGGRRVLVIGAGDAGEMLIRELNRNPGASGVPAAVIDADPSKHGSRLHGVPVIGGHQAIPSAVRRFHVDEILIAIPSATGSEMREIVELCSRTGVPFKTVPSLRELIGGRLSLAQARAVHVEDLLRRAPVEIDSPALARLLSGRRVMVTGAAGSIGSELVRRILRYLPGELILVDRAENALHDLLEELSCVDGSERMYAALLDITDRQRFHREFGRRVPEVIFHAAAYKQVPIAEHYPDAVVTNNIGGSRFLMDWSLERGVATFVNVSTDKAVRPRSVMGATKRAAELLALRRAEEGRTRFISVRFGNVLGSNGSVVPLFERQIRAGGPVTVTHPDITRYFMTASEAALLVLQAGAIGENGQTLVLDMGEPVRVVDLARDMIALSGLRPDIDIAIEYVGLRPGEKMTEELFGPDVTPRRSAHEKIWIVDAVDDAAPDFETRITELLQLAATGDHEATRRALIDVVPGFIPDGARDYESITPSTTGDHVVPFEQNG
ncbi:MAG: nucleoside-diphosphate sugar epimerase/dehydratase [Candidatus Zixiibacteriota bacterium]